MNHSGETLSQIGVWLSIVNQLYATRIRQLLSEHDLTSAQFALLNHLARHSDEAQTISQLTLALEVNQPGVTKIVQKLANLGYLTVTRDAVDSRKRLIAINRAGIDLINAVMRRLAPDFQQMFAEWDAAELAALVGHLQKLGQWLDEHRLDQEM